MQDFVSKRVRLFRNGDIYTPAKKLVVSPRIFRNYEQVLAPLFLHAQFLHNSSRELKLLNGAVRKIYTIDGKLIHSLDELVEGGAYVATGGEHFKRAPYIHQEKIQSLPPKPRKPYNSNAKTFLLTDTSKPERKDTPIFTTTVCSAA